MIFLCRRRATTPRFTRAMVRLLYAYGNMRAMRPESSFRTMFVPRSLRLRLVAFLVRMWLLKAWPALNLPDAVLRNRLAAARLVLILGMTQLLSCFSTEPSAPH